MIRRAGAALARALVLGLAVPAALVGCGGAGTRGGSVQSYSPAGATGSPATPPGAAARLLEWPEFGLDPQRSDTSTLATGITAANVGHLRHISVALPGTVDSSPILVHDVRVRGALRDVVVVSTSYGRTIALDAATGTTLWSFTPRGYRTWAGSAQITNASPLADPDRAYVYAASPDGLVHKLSLATGLEVRDGGWPARVTLEPRREKLGAALNIDGGEVLVATGGYLGDTPPYQGHVVALNRASGRIEGVFNTLCSHRLRLQEPSSCPASDSAILARGGAVVEPGGRRLLISTGNGPWNGTSDFGDSVLELSFPGLDLVQSYTPVDQEYLDDNDVDLGSSAPVLLGENRVLIAGKDGLMRVLELSALDGHGHGTRRLGGEVQQLPLVGGGELFSAPAVLHEGPRTTVFLADEHATAAFALTDGRLHELWQRPLAGTSPILAGGLLFVYEPQAGGIVVYSPHSGRRIARLPGRPGHWNSPIVADGHLVEPEGDANEHSLTGTLEIFSAASA